MNIDIRIIYYQFLNYKLKMWKEKDNLCWINKEIPTINKVKTTSILDDEDDFFGKADRILARYANVET